MTNEAATDLKRDLDQARAYAEVEELDHEQQEQQDREAFLAELGQCEDLDNPVGLDVYLDHLGEKLRQREEEIARTKEIVERRVAMVQLWGKDATDRIERECRWIKLQVEAFGRTYDYGSKKSRALPNVTFGFRSKPATLDIVDPAAAVEFAIANELETKVSVNKTPLLNHFKTTGEIPDGCEFREGTEEFFVKAGG